MTFAISSILDSELSILQYNSLYGATVFSQQHIATLSVGISMLNTQLLCKTSHQWLEAAENITFLHVEAC